MDTIKEQLISLFDEMLGKVEKFNKGSYNRIFLETFKKYESLVNSIADLLEEAAREDRKSLIDDISKILIKR